MKTTFVDPAIDSVDLVEPLPVPQIGSAVKHPASKRTPIKHVLLGQPSAIRHTIHRLHQLGYADADLWSDILMLTDRSLNFTPDPGEGLAMLVLHLNIK